MLKAGEISNGCMVRRTDLYDKALTLCDQHQAEQRDQDHDDQSDQSDSDEVPVEAGALSHLLMEDCSNVQVYLHSLKRKTPCYGFRSSLIFHFYGPFIFFPQGFDRCVPLRLGHSVETGHFVVPAVRPTGHRLGGRFGPVSGPHGALAGIGNSPNTTLKPVHYEGKTQLDSLKPPHNH